MPQLQVAKPGSVEAGGKSPRVAALRVVPVAGQDSMLLNLSGAHGPYFTRNLAILTDEAGNTGVGEVPGGEKIRRGAGGGCAAGRLAARWLHTTRS